jgi:hypothetical protein
MAGTGQNIPGMWQYRIFLIYKKGFTLMFVLALVYLIDCELHTAL